MKKFVLASLLVASSLMASQYATTVKPVYLDANSKSVAGKLLPTNAIDVLEEKNGMVKFSIKGYQNPAVSNVIYYSDGQRIISLAFAKTKAPKFELIKKGENGSWDEVKVEAYTTSGDFTSDLNTLFETSKKQYQENCSVCHALHKESQYTANQWPSLLKSMISRTPIDKKDEWTIIEYLQKHAKDTTKESK
ncbi:molybdopterin-containing oxidoreductase II, DMSO/TMAO/BSO reductase family, monoheme c-type cytochrome [Campylobacter iguaniorum]|uniref:hypothetical protein n=1 Tax=Campylobacter iguaniorum TaxID=1244531 RepID=UPI00073A524A|nr:hypothetical protein [Campylobacter iguaniorum]ALV23634.1 molybdopterin-containing oxidoreductase II, DMSO/TMAO/BSO reductase family, monoheme c-type cytochrome [Campylobacter iguaniorum]